MTPDFLGEVRRRVRVFFRLWEPLWRVLLDRALQGMRSPSRSAEDENPFPLSETHREGGFLLGPSRRLGEVSGRAKGTPFGVFGEGMGSSEKVLRVGEVSGRAKEIPFGVFGEGMGSSEGFLRVGEVSGRAKGTPFGVFGEGMGSSERVLRVGEVSGRAKETPFGVFGEGMVSSEEVLRVGEAPAWRLPEGFAQRNAWGTSEVARALRRREGVPSGVEALRGFLVPGRERGEGDRLPQERGFLVHVDRVEVHVAQVAEIAEVEAFNRMLGEALREEIGRFGV